MISRCLPLRAALSVVVLFHLLILVPDAHSATFGYARAFGGAGDDVSGGVAIDGAGNLYVTGLFAGIVDFEPGSGTVTLTSAGGYDVFVVKLDADGLLVWAQRFGGPGDDEGVEIALDGSGNVLVTGSFSGIADFDPGAGTVNLTSAGDTDGFAVKLNPRGDLLWARGFGGPGDDQGSGVGTDGAGAVYVTGQFSGTADFDPGAGTLNLTSAGDSDIFVLKLDSRGDLAWARGFGASDDDRAYRVAVDKSGNAHLTGHFRGTVDFDPGAGVVNLTSAGTTDIFAVKLNTNGDLVWARGFGGAAIDEGLGIAVDAAGRTYVTGVFAGTVDFDPGPQTVNLTSAGFTDVFVVKLDAGGNLVWARGFGGAAGSDGAYAVTIDTDSNVYLTGVFSGTADFDPGAGTVNLASIGLSDVFVSKLDAAGSLVWARAFGGTGADRGYGLAVDLAGNVYGSGHFAGPVDFDPGPGTANLISSGPVDAFAIKLVQAAPPIHTLPAPQTIAEDTALVFSSANGNAISVADADAGSSPLRMTLATSDGVLTLGTTANLAFSRGDGSADVEMAFTGTVQAINAALQGLTYTPRPNEYGTAALSITTVDEVGPSGSQQDRDLLALTIVAVNDPPTATNDAYQTTMGQPLTVSPQAGVLQNDSDADQSPLTAFLLSGPAHGTLDLSLNGGFTYTPQPGFGGSDSFSYHASDGSAASSPATVAIAVTGSACDPRPRVTSTVGAGGGRLQVHVQATPLNTTASNALQRLTFTRLENARVTMDAQQMTNGQTYTVPANVGGVDFTVERLVPGQPTTVHLSIVDGCGEWRTFVGGGAGAGF